MDSVGRSRLDRWPRGTIIGLEHDVVVVVVGDDKTPMECVEHWCGRFLIGGAGKIFGVAEPSSASIAAAAWLSSALPGFGVCSSFVPEVPVSLMPMSGLMVVKVQTPETSSSAPPSLVGMAGGSGR